MKNLFYFTVHVGILFHVPCNGNGKDAATVIREAYQTEGSIFRIVYNLDEVVVLLPLLYQKYCSKDFCNYLMEELEENGVGHDLLTADYGMDENSIKSMRIQKVVDGVYRVFWIVYREAPNLKIRRYNVALEVRMVKEDGKYKIDDVCDLTLWPW